MRIRVEKLESLHLQHADPDIKIQNFQNLRNFFAVHLQEGEHFSWESRTKFSLCLAVTANKADPAQWKEFSTVIKITIVFAFLDRKLW